MGNRSSTANETNKDVIIGKKRSLNETVTDDEQERIEEENLHTPKKKRLKSTSQYIYETLFINGENSDIKIVAFNKEWKLHKVYLCQASYFSSMFSGSWKESQDSVIFMDIPDDNIDVEALNISFGSLYSDEVLISGSRVISVLAAATLLGLDGLIQQCVNVMQETISSKTVCGYHAAASMYGQEDMIRSCAQWLERNLMFQASPPLLKEIGCDLMREVVKSPDLHVLQVEMDVYSLLKKWMFVHTTSDTLPDTMKELTPLSDAFWKGRFSLQGDDDSSTLDQEVDDFVMTSEGKPFSGVLRALRLPHIINDLASAKIIEADKIIPMAWLMPVYRQQWLQMVKVEQGHDKGPQNLEGVNFGELSMRCGRILAKDGEYCWRWTGYNYGIDLLVSFSGRLLIFKRNTASQPAPGAVSLHSSRHILYNLTVSSLNALGHSRFHRSTGVKRLELAKDEESVIMGVDRLVAFPLHVTCQFLAFTPRKRYRMHPSVTEEDDASSSPT